MTRKRHGHRQDPSPEPAEESLFRAFTPGQGLWRSGGAIYFKPGWGVGLDANSGDRSSRFEIGFRCSSLVRARPLKMMQEKMGGG